MLLRPRTVPLAAYQHFTAAGIAALAAAGRVVHICCPQRVNDNRIFGNLVRPVAESCVANLQRSNILVQLVVEVANDGDRLSE